jgi:hypothetical protein
VRAAAAEGAPPPAGDSDEAAYAAELAAELAGVPFSAAAAGAGHGATAAKPRARAAAAPAARLEPEAPGSEAEALSLSHVLLPRKSKELYKAMQMGRQKKAVATGVLCARKNAAAAAADADKKR